MKTILVLLTVLAVSSGQSDDLSQLISSVFPRPRDGQAPPGGTAAPSEGLPGLINQVFGPNGNPTNGSPTNNPQPPIGAQNDNDADDDCECVPYYQCSNGTILQNGLGLLDIRIRVCDSYLDVCCKRPSILTSPDPVPTPSSPIRNVCGVRNANGVGFRITGAEDNEAQFAEFPWMAAILKHQGIGPNGSQLNTYQCGASLVHPQVVLTAAHCVGTSTDFIVRVGEWDTQTKHEPLPHQDRNVLRTVAHPNFHPGALYNDVALMFLDAPVNLAANVGPVCLPQSGEVFDGSRCFAAGWGKDVFGKEGHYQVIMKKVELPIVNHVACQNSLRTTRLGRYFVLDRSFVCAGGEAGKDTCRGDGGSPLVCPLAEDPTRYVQAGIVSWGIGCGERNIPGVYANVASARDWIDQQIAQNLAQL